MIRPDKRRENIVALTQTEIMLVLTVMVLFLLAVKNADLAVVCDELTDDSCRDILGHAAAQGVAPPQKEDAPLSQAELDEPVTEDLVAGGAPEQNVSSLISIADEDGLPQEDTPDAGEINASELASVAIAALEQEKQSAEVEVVRQRVKSERLAKENESLQRENEELRAAAEQLSSLAIEDKNEPVQEQQEIRHLEDDLALVNRVGFLPCWRRAESPFHYYAFKLTYAPDTDTFLIEPHADSGESVREVLFAVQSDLWLVQTPPRGWLSRDKFAGYMARVEHARRVLYGDKSCRLSATINKKSVDGNVITFINGTRLYPVYR